MARVGVVGHVEWVRFAVVERVPRAGEIVHARESFQEPAGGGAVAAVVLRRLAGAATFLTALGDDGAGERAGELLREHHGLDLRAAVRPGAQRRAFVHLDDDAERTITVLGERVVPLRADPLPWEALEGLDGVYLTGGDAGAVRAARGARVLVATARALEALAAARVRVDVLVHSRTDVGEAYEPGMLDPEPVVVAGTRGAHGGEWLVAGGADDDVPEWVPAGARSGSWSAAPLPGPPVDSYGCGDSFAAGLTYGLAAGLDLPGALDLGARCGAACLTGRGPYGAEAPSP